MKFNITRENLLKPLQAVSGVIERRQTLPVLSNLLIEASGNEISFTGTDLEVELIAKVNNPIDQPGEITLPARKLLDICKNLPDESTISIQVSDGKAHVNCGRSQFTLTTLPASDFPSVEDIGSVQGFDIQQGELKKLIERTHFAMALQDVRYYLNGLLLEMTQGRLRAVATDGHRLAIADNVADINIGDVLQVIVPRKGVQELMRLMDDSGESVRLEIGANHIRATLSDLKFTSKLIDGRFPDYERVIPATGDNLIAIEKQALKQALIRASILSNEKYRGIRLGVNDSLLTIQAHNPEQEEAQEEVSIEYKGNDLEVGFNVTYLLDAINAIETDGVTLSMQDSNSSCLIRGENAAENSESRYVVMPMRL